MRAFWFIVVSLVGGWPAGVVAADTWPTEMARQMHLEAAHEHQAALAHVRRLLVRAETTSAESQYLLDRVAFNLFNLHRVVEGVACYDRQILDAVDHPAERLALLAAKATLLASHVEPARGVAACREFRAAAARGSEPWKRATDLLATALAASGQHAEAIALRRELLALDTDKASLARARWWFEIARSQRAISEPKLAVEALDAAEQALPSRAETPEAQSEIERLSDQIARLRQMIGAK